MTTPATSRPSNSFCIGTSSRSPDNTTGWSGQISAIDHSSDPSISTMPVSAMTTVPGAKKISSPTRSTPIAKTRIGSCPDSPATKLLRNTIASSTMPVIPKIPKPGVLNSTNKATRPSPINNGLTAFNTTASRSDHVISSASIV